MKEPGPVAAKQEQIITFSPLHLTADVRYLRCVSASPYVALCIMAKNIFILV